MTPAELVAKWEADAGTLEHYGDERGAAQCRLQAAELRDALAASEEEPLTLSAAAKLSGYSSDHLRHLIADGTIPNAGRKGSPKIRRGDLPMKPGCRDTPDGAAEDILRSIRGDAA